MCCSSAAAGSPMAEFLKSQAPQELWKASLKPNNPVNANDLAKPSNPFDPANASAPLQAAKAPGTGLLVDTTA